MLPPHVTHYTWLSDEEVADCGECAREFNIVLCRRHHCRRCGRIFCDDCTLNRLHIGGAAYRLCDGCTDRLVDGGSSQVVVVRKSARRSGCSDLPMKRTLEISADMVDSRGKLLVFSPLVFPSSSSEESDAMENCPVCSLAMAQWSTKRAQRHLDECMSSSVASHSVRGDRYTIYQNSVGGTNTKDGEECSICYEEMSSGQRIAILNCLCRFHSHCIALWFKRGHCCPYHP